ncbi:MAG: TonB-dependent receptor plug domain-containing protein [Rhodospirillaceae bacterium]
MEGILITKSSRGIRARALFATATSAVALMALAPAHAQAPQSNAGAVDEIIVTGSRIVRDGYEAPTPTTVLSVEQLQNQASPNLIDYLTSMPTFSGNYTPQSSTQNISQGTAGTSSVNLRNLGIERTLILINGQRSVPSTVSGRVDVNAIPSQLIQRTDVVTGGASAAYGSDAVAGVVNFILDTRFTGVKGEISGGVTDYGDNANGKIGLTAGTPFASDRGHFTVSGELTDQQGILIADRPWNARGFGFMVNPAYGTGPGQTRDVPQRLLLEQVGPAQATKGGIIVSGPLKGIAFGPGGVPYNFNYGDLVSGGLMRGGEWKAQDIHIDNGQSIEPRMSSQNFFTRLSYQLGEQVEVYAQYNWYHNHFFSNGYGMEDFGGVNVPITNPFLDPSVRTRAEALGLTQITIGSSNRDMGMIGQDNERWTQRLVAGVNGDFEAFDTEWSWDAYYQMGVSRNSERAINSRIEGRYRASLDSLRHPTTGTIICRSTLTNPNDGCVPYNPFGVGVNSIAQLDYVLDNSYRYQKFTQDVVAASIQGEPFSTWAGPVSVATGAEHRNEESVGINSALDQQRVFFGGNYQPTFGKYHVTEGFFETIVPLARDTGFAQTLDLNAAVRATEYSAAGYVTTWKAGATWTPVDDITIRLTRSRDIRAPNIGDLYNAGTVVVNNVNNTIDGTQASVQYVGTTRGNPTLVPEKADTTGIGVVLRPSFLEGFGASVDYWNINVKGAITIINAQQIVDLCAQGNTSFCNAINAGHPVVRQGTLDRNRVDNTIFIQPFNLARQNARGLDFDVTYALPLSTFSDDMDGTIRLRALASHYIKNFRDTGLTAPTDTAGENNGGGPASWRWSASATYDAEPLSVTLTARGVSSGTYNNDFVECQTGCPISAAPNFTVNSNHIPGAIYWDFATSYEIFTADEGDGNVEAFLNIKNITNKDAVMVGGNGNFATDTVTTNTANYDSHGRTYRVGIRFRM